MSVSPPVPPQGEPLRPKDFGVFDEEQLAHASTEQVAQRLRRLQAVSADLLGALAVEAVVRTMVESGLSLLGAVAGAVWMLDRERGMLALQGHVGYPADVIACLTDMPLDARAPAAESALHAQRVTLLSVAERDERYPGLLGGASVGAAYVCEPLVQGGEVLGVLSASFADGGLLTDPANLSFFDTVIAQCSVALHRARMISVERRSRDRLELLAESGRLFAGVTEARPLCEELCRLATDRLADVAIVVLAGPDDTWQIAGGDHADPLIGHALNGFARTLDGRGGDLIRSTMDSGLPRLFQRGDDDYRDLVDEAAQLALLHEIDLGSGLVLPLRAHGRGLGVLTMATIGQRPPLGADDLAEMRELAGRLALALDNARLFHQQSEIAHTLQRSLLPVDLPAVAGAEVAVRYLPGTRGMSVGGDFYDVVPLPSGCVGLVVGDVMGRGVRAAAVMGQVRAAIRGYVLEGHSPAGILGRLDRLVASLDDALIVTCCYVEWDPTTDRALLACAGHPPPLLVSHGDPAAFLPLEPGPPLGVGLGSYGERVVTLPLGSLLLLYTDGLVESPDLPVDEGMRRLARAVDGVRGAEAACEAALAVQPASDDDVALLALWTLPAGEGQPISELVQELPADIQSPAQARSAVEHVLASWGLDELVETATLLVSEVVTNAVRHAGTSLRLRTLRLATDGVRVEVVDQAPHAPLRRGRPNAAAEGGRGLHLIEHLARRWGVESTDLAKTVWFELSL